MTDEEERAFLDNWLSFVRALDSYSLIAYFQRVIWTRESGVLQECTVLQREQEAMAATLIVCEVRSRDLFTFH
jgi:hypothetical protein